MKNKLFGLIGYPLDHSFSKNYFTEKFKKAELTDHQYLNFPIDSIDKIETLLKKHPNLNGLNVTIPYKEKVIPYLDEISQEAKAIGAVNTIKILRDSNKIRLKGFNTDAAGFKKSLKPFLTFKHERALILGTGGASKAVAHVLKNMGIEYLFVSRTPKNDQTIGYDQVNQYVIKFHLLIINTSPVGTFPNVNDSPDIPYEFISNEHFLYDLIYNPERSLFLQKGKEKGAKILNGYDMLINQAEEAWKIWNS